MATLQDLLSDDQGPGLRTPSLDVYGPRKGLGSTDVQGLINYFRANPEAAMSMEELRQAAQERDLTRQTELARRAALGDQRAAAEMVGQKARQAAVLEREQTTPAPGTPFTLRQLVTVAGGLGKLDEEAQANLLSQLIPGLARGRTKPERLAEETAARVRATAQEKLNVPLGLAELSKLYRYNPVTKDMEIPTDPEMTGRQAKESGFRPLTEKQNKSITDLDDTMGLISEIRSITNRLITATGTSEGITHGTALTAKSYLPGTLAKIYSDKKEAFLGILSRTLGQEKGVLTDRDIQRVSGAMPGFYETVKSKDFKNETLLRILDIARDARMRAIFGGKPTVDARKSIEALLDKLEGETSLTAKGKVPQVALDYLKAHPDTKEQFKAKFGYLPPGF